MSVNIGGISSIRATRVPAIYLESDAKQQMPKRAKRLAVSRDAMRTRSRFMSFEEDGSGRSEESNLPCLPIIDTRGRHWIRLAVPENVDRDQPDLSCRVRHSRSIPRPAALSHGELLHAPVRRFRCVDLVLRRARERVHAGELLQLTPRIPDNAEHLPVE